jgi:hypothetical protein
MFHASRVGDYADAELKSYYGCQYLRAPLPLALLIRFLATPVTALPRR